MRVSRRTLLAESARTWRACGYLLIGLASAVATVLGLPVLCFPAAARGWAAWHRLRASRWLGRPGADPGSGYRILLWLPVHTVTGLAFGLVALLCAGNMVTAVIAMPFWAAFEPASRPRLFVDVPVNSWTTALTLGAAQLLLLAVVAYAGFFRLADAHARLCLTVLRPSAVDQLTRRVTVLTRTRAEVLDAHGAELRRIERDLHDGTQARLVAIAVRLGVARQAMAGDVRDEAMVQRLLQEAHEGTEEAMAELRDVIRSVYPPILADRGLDGALAAVVARCPVPARLDVDDLGRVPAAVEAVAYFAVTEALTNVARHSGAREASVRVRRTDTGLSAVITDDGEGGADDRNGTGLAGMRRRVQALDGTLTVDSPDGGPTVLTVELPCG